MVDKLEVVFDPSLLLPPSHLIIEDMEPASVQMTDKMSDFMFQPSGGDYLPSLLNEWISEKVPYELPISWKETRKCNSIYMTFISPALN